MSEPPKDKIMTTQNNDGQVIPAKVKSKRRRCLVVAGVLVSILLLLFIVALVLALTVFKSKQPRIKIASATLEGVSSRVFFPAIRIRFNLTLDLQILLENRNHASFKHGQGKTLLFYQGRQVGDADIYPGLIPARASSTLPCRLTLQLDQFASNNVTGFIGDIITTGQLSIETRTRIPGRVSLLGIFKKHVVALYECRFTFGIPDRKMRSQICKNKTKL